MNLAPTTRLTPILLILMLNSAKLHPQASAAKKAILTAVSLVPVTGSGTQQSFTAAVSDSEGYGDLYRVQIVIMSSNPNQSLANGCRAMYDNRVNRFFLINDAGIDWLGPINPNSSSTLQNSQCVLLGTGSSASRSGNTLTVTSKITFKSSYTGTKGLYVYARNATINTGFVSMGNWTIPAHPH